MTFGGTAINTSDLLTLAEVLGVLVGRTIRIVRYDDAVLRGRFDSVKSSVITILGKEIQIPEAIIYNVDGELIEAPFVWIKSVEFGDDTW